MACPFGEGFAVLNHDSGTFFVLDEVAAFLWNELASPTTPERLSAAVGAAYDAAPDQIEGDVRNFLESMIESRLIELSAAA